MISGILYYLGFGSLGFDQGSGLLTAGTDALGGFLNVFAGNLANWGS